MHTIDGVTAHEMCHYFWDTDVRMEWECNNLSFCRKYSGQLQLLIFNISVTQPRSKASAFSMRRMNTLPSFTKLTREFGRRRREIVCIYHRFRKYIYFVCFLCNSLLHHVIFVLRHSKVDDIVPELDGEVKPHDTYIVCNFSIDHPDNKVSRVC